EKSAVGIGLSVEWINSVYCHDGGEGFESIDQCECENAAGNRPPHAGVGKETDEVRHNDAVFERIGRNIDQEFGIDMHDLTENGADGDSDQLRRHHAQFCFGQQFWKGEQNEQANDTDEKYCRIGLHQVGGSFGHETEELVSMTLMTDQSRNLLG